MLDKNQLFESIIKTAESEKILALTEKALLEQWNDLIFSGIVNTIYSKYHQFFIRRRGKKATLKKSFKKAEEDMVESPEDLKALANANLQADKISVADKFLLMAPLLLFLRGNIGTKQKSISSYYNLKSEMSNYLKFSANKAGQSVIDKIPTPKAIKFRLSNKQYKAKIKQRVDTLVKGLDKTTKERLTNSLVRGIKAGETKTDMVKRLQKEGVVMSKERAKRIVYTETEGIAEYMRLETAKLNGIRYKIWMTVVDSRGPCEICEPVDGQRVRVSQNFQTPVGPMQCPLLHPNCRCYLEYDVENSLCTNYVKSVSVWNRIEALFSKAKKDALYESIAIEDTKCCNTENVWGGGETAVGKDKDISQWAAELEKYKGSELMRDKILAQARESLTDEGFAQLKLRAGLKGETLSRSVEDRFLDKWENYLGNYDTSYSDLLSEEQQLAVKAYTDMWYQDLNKILRIGNIADSEKLDSLANMLDSALDIANKKTGTVYRGAGMLEDTIKQIKAGSTFIDKGYMSATTSFDKADTFAIRQATGVKIPVIFEVRSKTGADIAEFSKYKTEKEVLFKRNTSFKVVSIKKDVMPDTESYMGYFIKLEEVVVKSKATDKLWAEILTIVDAQEASEQKEQNERI